MRKIVVLLAAAWSAAARQPVEKRVDTGATLVTRDNAAQFLHP